MTHKSKDIQNILSLFSISQSHLEFASIEISILVSPSRQPFKILLKWCDYLFIPICHKAKKISNPYPLISCKIIIINFIISCFIITSPYLFSNHLICSFNRSFSQIRLILSSCNSLDVSCAFLYRRINSTRRIDRAKITINSTITINIAIISHYPFLDVHYFSSAIKIVDNSLL